MGDERTATVTRGKPVGCFLVALVLGVVLVSGCGDTQGAAEPEPDGRISESETPSAATESDGSGVGACEDIEQGTGTPGQARDRVTIGSVTRNPPGADNAKNLNKEVVSLTTNSERTIDLSGWTIEDNEGVVYTFPPGSSFCRYLVILVHSGRGVDTATDYFANWGWRWDHQGDTVRLRDANHAPVATCSYDATSPALNC